MPSLTLKEIPEELMDRLRAAARRERRSLVQHALYLIEGGLLAQERAEGTPPPHVAEQVRRWRELTGRWRSDERFEDEVAGIADARTAGRTVDL